MNNLMVDAQQLVDLMKHTSHHKLEVLKASLQPHDNEMCARKFGFVRIIEQQGIQQGQYRYSFRHGKILYHIDVVDEKKFAVMKLKYAITTHESTTCH